MSHHFLLLHFGVQCPWQPWVVEQVREAAKCLNGSVEVLDVSGKPELAERYQLFTPFLILINYVLRVPAPTPAVELVRIAKEGIRPAPLEPLRLQEKGLADAVVPLTVSNLKETCRLCVPDPTGSGIRKKTAWGAGIIKHLPGEKLGFCAWHGGRVVGAVECLPSELIPYPLPRKESEIAFITCLYSLEEGPDYRQQVLERLLEYLAGTTYREVQVIVGQHTPYPNGPEAFFRPYGFIRMVELGKIALREGEDEVFLLRRDLADFRDLRISAATSAFIL
jgi:hypothetical protein